MSCDCIIEIDKKLQLELEDPEARIAVAFTLPEGIQGNKMLCVPYGLTAKYRKKKKDGSYSDKKSQINLTPTFCPFCGVKYGN